MKTLFEKLEASAKSGKSVALFSEEAALVLRAVRNARAHALYEGEVVARNLAYQIKSKTMSKAAMRMADAAVRRLKGIASNARGPMGIAEATVVLCGPVRPVRTVDPSRRRTAKKPATKKPSRTKRT